MSLDRSLGLPASVSIWFHTHGLMHKGRLKGTSMAPQFNGTLNEAEEQESVVPPLCGTDEVNRAEISMPNGVEELPRSSFD